MSEKLLFDVDERINSIKNSLSHLSSNLELTPSRENLKSSQKKRQKQKPNSSPKSSKKSPKPFYVSNYVAFGNTAESDSSSLEIESPKRVIFDPTATEMYPVTSEFKGETLTKDNYYTDIFELQQQLSLTKEKNSELESIISQKEQEIIQLLGSQEILKKHLDLKTKNLEDSEKIVERLKEEILNLNGLVGKYQGAIHEFESFQKEYESHRSDNSKDHIKISLLQEEIQALQIKLKTQENELETLQYSNRELERENTHFEKCIKKNKEKYNSSQIEKKLKDKIKSLKHANENLKEELKKKPNEAVLKETEKKLADLERFVADHCGKKGSGTAGNDKKVLGSLMVLLKVQKKTEIFSKVQEMTRQVGGQKFELSKKLRNLIVKYSPPGSFGSLPSDKRILSWFKRLIEEYLLKLKQEEFNSSSMAALKQCMKCLNVTFPEDLLTKLEELKIKIKD